MSKLANLIGTVVGVITLGGAFGLNILYLTLQDKPQPDQITMGTFGGIFNVAVVFWLIWIIIFKNPYAAKWKSAAIISALLIGWVVEVYFLASDPEFNTKYSMFSYGILSLNTILRLVVLISVRCNTTVVQTVIKTATAAATADSTGLDMSKIWDRAFGQYNTLLRDSGKTEDERLELVNKFRGIFNMPPKEPRPVREGGRR